MPVDASESSGAIATSSGVALPLCARSERTVAYLRTLARDDGRASRLTLPSLPHVARRGSGPAAPLRLPVVVRGG